MIANDVIQFLIASKALTFGDFTLKSGRKAPYFVNTGIFADGESIGRLGSYYARHIVDKGLSKADVLFGPAYKGIPLAVATATALHKDFGVTVGCSYDRKEAKDHGEGGVLWGAPITKGSRVVIVEDVVTAGTTLNKVVPLLRETSSAEILGVVILVDRCEKGESGISAVQEIQKRYDVPVLPIVTIHQIVKYLSEKDHGVSSTVKQKIDAYLEHYGA